MLIDRRDFFVGVVLGACFPVAARAQSDVDWKALATEDTEAPRLPEALWRYADQPSLEGPITTYRPFGTKPPTPEEEKLAKAVLNKVPTNCTPVEVALYFLNVGLGKYGENLRPYVTAWPVRWNPVIVEFFTSTGTLPSGDTTPWCAALLNYCLLKAQTGKTLATSSSEPTMSAASRSFRTWGRQIDLAAGERPQPGDVVVFRNVNSPGNGHVAFFLAENASTILVLGGNQFEGVPVRHTINRKRISKNGNTLVFHSYRTDPQLHA